LLRCRFGHRSQVCRQWSGRCEYPPHPARALRCLLGYRGLFRGRIQGCCCGHTDGDRLDLDAILDVSSVGIVRVLVGEDTLAAEGVDEGRSAWEGREESARSCDEIMPEGGPGASAARRFELCRPTSQGGEREERTCAGSTADHKTELNSLLHVLLLTHHLL
jgi:hypothetical protein